MRFWVSTVQNTRCPQVGDMHGAGERPALAKERAPFRWRSLMDTLAAMTGDSSDPVANERNPGRVVVQVFDRTDALPYVELFDGEVE